MPTPAQVWRHSYTAHFTLRRTAGNAPCRLARSGALFGFYVHGNSDTSGAVRGVQTVNTGLGWQAVYAPVLVIGQPTKEDRDACWDLGATVAAELSSTVD